MGGLNRTERRPVPLDKGWWQLTWSRMSKMSFPSPRTLVITLPQIEVSGPVAVVIALVSPDAKSTALSTICPQIPCPSLTMIHPTVTMSVGAVICALHLHQQYTTAGRQGPYRRVNISQLLHGIYKYCIVCALGASCVQRSQYK